MKKQVQMQQKNGHTNGVRQNKSKLSIPEIEAFITEAQEVLKMRKKKNTKRKKEPEAIVQPKPAIIQKLKEVQLQRLTKNHQQEKTKRKFLEQEVKQRDNNLAL